MNNRHPWQLKKSKSRGPFWSYQLNSTANTSKIGPNGLNWQCCLAGSSKTAPRILIFSIAIGAEYSYEVKNMVRYGRPHFSSIIIHLLLPCFRQRMRKKPYMLRTFFISITQFSWELARQWIHTTVKDQLT